MKNLSKKIGVGVVASSLVIGGAVSTGLVANADSVVESQIEQVKRNEKLSQFGDLEIVKYAKSKYNFKIFGYYFRDSLTNRNKMEDEINDVSKYAQGKGFVGYEKIKQIEKKLPEELLIGEVDKNKFDFDFNDGKEFLEHLYTNGMTEGVKKVRIGDAVTILVFKNKVQSGIDWYQDKELDKLKGANLQVKDVEDRDYLDLDVLDNVSKFLISYSDSVVK